MSEASVAIYLVNGFLDSGKTTLLHDTMGMDYFNDGQRTVLIMCEDGEIEANDSKKQIVIRKHVSSPADTFEERVINIRTNGSGHGGGDAGIMEAFTKSLEDPNAKSRTTISESVESHLMAGAIELSRLTGKTINIAEYRNSLT